MSTINFAGREINCKIVYYGPGMSGKTTNLKHVFSRVPDHLRGEMVSLATEDERTLFFDFLPLDLGSVQGFKTRFHLYTVPGQVFYNASRKLILRGVDGIVFVADSAPNRLRANAESMRNLRENLLEHGLDIRTIPMVLQVNKRDIEGALPTAMIRAVIDPKSELNLIEAVAHQGQGVFETLKAVSKMVLERLSQPSQAQ
ncbi:MULTISPECIES: GTPase MglA [Deinococcus]|uniref:Gliding motility protein n=1 Tax=Deinococcus ruber TaxID=1848197 RepID=A0A918F960_9DEIO|nr:MULTISPECIES: ADP-ribosylation factor-like protein [Deinococcus]ULH15098.1 ADP-ribosylation factor-like protein [Deinococcus sp. KNUC1210]GGR12333.1 gliding motility protein [Deinococcus ruber]